MKIYKEVISDCFSCPQFKYSYSIGKYMCKYTERIIHESVGIPKWCPLEELEVD